MKIFWFLHAPDRGAGSDELTLSLRRSRWILWTIFFTLVVFVTWAHFANVDQITRAPGSVISSARSQIIQSLDGGVIEELMVKEGDTVQRGQVLVKLDHTRQQSGYLETRGKVVALATTVARLQAEVLAGSPASPRRSRFTPNSVKTRCCCLKSADPPFRKKCRR